MKVKLALFSLLFIFSINAFAFDIPERDIKIISNYSDEKLCIRFAMYTFKIDEPYKNFTLQMIQERNLIHDPVCRQHYQDRIDKYVNKNNRGRPLSFEQAAGIENLKEITIGKSDPGKNYTSVGSVTGTSGQRCGPFSPTGNYELSMELLKVQARKLDADYIQIFSQESPHLTGNCTDNTYTITGQAFKKTSFENADQLLPKAQHPASSKIQELRELKELFDEGVIDKNEYEKLKKKIIDD